MREYASMDADCEYGDSLLSSFPDPKLTLIEFNLYKETPKGYWIGYGNLSNLYEGLSLRNQSRWIPKASKKRYAYPTKEEALNYFIIRTQRRLEHAEYEKNLCEAGISLAKNLKF